jgi:hypothetical protein
VDAYKKRASVPGFGAPIDRSHHFYSAQNPARSFGQGALIAGAASRSTDAPKLCDVRRRDASHQNIAVSKLIACLDGDSIQTIRNRRRCNIKTIRTGATLGLPHLEGRHVQSTDPGAFLHDPVVAFVNIVDGSPGGTACRAPYCPNCRSTDRATGMPSHAAQASIRRLAVQPRLGACDLCRFLWR